MTSDAQRHRPHDPTEHDHVHGNGCGHRVVSHEDHLITYTTDTGTPHITGTTTNTQPGPLTSEGTPPAGSPRPAPRASGACWCTRWSGPSVTR